MSGKPSEAQIELLRLVQKFGDEQEYQWGEIGTHFVRGARNLEAATMDSVAKALERRGLIRETDEGPRTTPAGIALLGAGARA